MSSIIIIIIKKLGITIDKHVKNISSKSSEINCMLSVPILKLLSYPSSYPYINYGIESWFEAPDYAFNEVWVLQNLVFSPLLSHCPLFQIY